MGSRGGGPHSGEYLKSVDGVYSSCRPNNAIDIGSMLVKRDGSFRNAYRHVRELKMRELAPTRARWGGMAHLVPAISGQIQEGLRVGVIRPTGEIISAENRQRGLPHERRRTAQVSQEKRGIYAWVA